MDDLISRQAAIDMIHSTFSKSLARQRAEECIKKVPAVQAERKKGRWVHDGYDFPGGVDWIHCSECGKRGINVPADLSNYCPNCGADMRGERNE